MATRWKLESPDTLILMHEHNHFSQWYGYLLESADLLDIPVCRREYRNCSGDGSWDTEWLVPKGTRKAVVAYANEIRERYWKHEARENG